MSEVEPRLSGLIDDPRNVLRLLIAFGLFVVAACAAPAFPTPETTSQEVADEAYRQRVTYVRTLLTEQERLARIAHQVSVRVVDLCGDRTTYATGAFLFDWDQTTDEWVDAANEAIGINLHTPGIEVLVVLPNSPAEQAGLRVGDRVIRLGDWRIPSGRGAFDQFRDRLNASLAAGRNAVELRVLRGAEFKTITLTPIEACDYPVLIADNNAINAYTDGRKIVVFRGMFRFARDDDELAIVIAHELAHVALGHIDARRQNALTGAAVGAVVDILVAGTIGARTRIGQSIGANIGALAYSREFEAEADYMGAYMVAKAGFDFTKIPDFQRHTGTLGHDRLLYARTHPGAPSRAVAMEKTVREIQDKADRGLPLVPERGPIRPKSTSTS